MPRAGPAMQQEQGRARSRARDTPPHSADNRRISLAGRMADMVAASPDCEASCVIAPIPAKTTSRLRNFMFNVLPGGRRGAASENIGMAFNCFFGIQKKDATDALHHHRQGSAFSSARTSRTEFAAARSLKSSNELWPGSPPARSDKLRTATKGILFA